MFHRYSGRAAVAAGLFISTSLSTAIAADQQSAAPSNNRIEGIVITASPLTDDPDKLATIVGTVDRDEILKSGGANLADVLSSVPGVTGTSFAGGASRPVIRGFDANRVRLLEDGIGSFDVSDVGPDHGVPIDPLSAQKIEVIRGAATLRYGSQAIGGVVNTINNRVPLALPEASLSGEASGAYSTNANSGESSGLVDGRAGSLAFHADGFVRQTDDYGTPLGVQGNSYFRGDGFSAGSSYFFGENDQNRVGAAIVHYDAKYGIPSDTTFIDMRQTKGMFKSFVALNAGSLQNLTVDGGYADYKHNEVDPATGDVLSTFLDKEWDARSEALFGALGPFSGTALGVQLQHKDFSALGDAHDYLNPTTTQSFAGFAFTEAPVMNTLRLQFGARVEHVSADGTPQGDIATTRHFTPVSGSAGLVFEASEQIRLGLTVTSSARAPGQTEMFARGPHDGPGTFETGNPNLKIERANSAEATVRLHTSDVVFEGSAWGAKFDNYIYGNITGRTCDAEGVCAADDSGDFKELLYQQRGAKFWGLEAKSTINLAAVGEGTLGVNAIADYVRATFAGGGNVPRMPPYHLGGGLFWTNENIDADVMVKHTGAQNNVAVAETPTAGYTSLDAQLSWRPWADHPRIEIAVIGHNLTDTVQRNAVSINKDVVVLPGRDARLVLRSAF